MKKVALLSIAFFALAIVACGPSAEDTAKKEQAMKDSMDKAQKMAQEQMVNEMAKDTANKAGMDTIKH